jgi:hypothetical protein
VTSLLTQQGIGHRTLRARPMTSMSKNAAAMNEAASLIERLTSERDEARAKLVQADSSEASSNEKFRLAAEWQPIESAPKDGTPFLTLQNGEIYRAKYFIGDRPRIAFRTHTLRTPEQHRIIDAEMDGKRVKAKVAVGEPWAEEFRHDWCFWTRGFAFAPTHWMPLPLAPDSSLNFSDESGSDSVSLKQT